MTRVAHRLRPVHCLRHMADDERGDTMRFCDDKIVDENGNPSDDLACPGHLAKFDDCVQEALYELTSDNGGLMNTGNDEFEGTYTLFRFSYAEPVRVDADSNNERWVIVPEGYYILQTTSGGFAYTLKYPSLDEAHAAYQTAEERYLLWDKGCEQTGHEACEEHDECQLGGVPSY